MTGQDTLKPNSALQGRAHVPSATAKAASPAKAMSIDYAQGISDGVKLGLLYQAYQDNEITLQLYQDAASNPSVAPQILSFVYAWRETVASCQRAHDPSQPACPPVGPIG
jgi:hypothetical protein